MNIEDAHEGQLVQLKDEYAHEFMERKVKASSRIVSVNGGEEVVELEYGLHGVGKKVDVEKLETL